MEREDLSVHPFARALLLALVLSTTFPVSAGEPVKLVVLVAVDQLRRDRLADTLPGGLGRLAREGRVYSEAVLDHAATATCPGHISISSGSHPGRAGVPGNSYVDRASGEMVYCVEDAREDARVLGGDGGRSPALLRVTTLGDWMKQARPATRVVSVAGKDRSAIALGGKRADGAWWYSRRRGFTTSRHYRAELPEWLVAWNDGLPARVPEQWQHAAAPPGRPRPDDYAAESPDHSRTSPHPIWSEDREQLLDNLFFTPFLDLLTLDLALELVRREQLGADPTPDLLAVGLSATDAVGHLYGPESHEAYDALQRLDVALGRFLDQLEREVGKGRVLVALSADHGVLPLPEWLAETDRSKCPVDPGRVGIRWLALRLLWNLHREFGPLLALPERWVHISGAGLTVDRALAAEHEVAVPDVVRAAEAYLEDHAAVREVWTAAEIRERTDPIARLYRNSFDPERSGDLVVQLEPTCMIGSFDHGTSHGSPYLYDRAVPIVFHGPGVERAVVPGPARTVDIAPTLARQVGVPVPDSLDGAPIF